MDAGTGLNIASGVLLAAVGGWVLTLRPRRPENLTFAVFAIANGLRPVPANLAIKLGVLREANLTAATALTVVAVVSLVIVAVHFPRPLRPDERRPLGIAVLSGGALGGVLVAYAAVFFRDTGAGVIQNLAFSATIGIAAAALLVFALAPLQRLADRSRTRPSPRLTRAPAVRATRSLPTATRSASHGVMEGSARRNRSC